MEQASKESSMNRSFLFAGAIAAAMVGWSPVALADNPREFLQNAQQGNNSEIMLGRLAAEQARSPAVRDFANALVSDHRQARNDVRDVGQRLGLQPDRDVSPEAREERDRLMGLRGRDFDREFIRFMVEDHRRDIGDFRDEARENHGPVSELAQRQLPTLRNHLRMAIALERSDGRSSEIGMARDRDRDDNQYRGDNQYRDDRNRDDNQYRGDNQYRDDRAPYRQR
jgi:putative membrane protein